MTKKTLNPFKTKGCSQYREYATKHNQIPDVTVLTPSLCAYADLVLPKWLHKGKSFGVSIDPAAA